MDDVEQAVTAYWSTALSDIEPGSIRLRGYPVEQLIGGATFAETIWLLLRGELPHPAQARLLEAALVAAVDHGPQAPSIAAARMASTCGLPLNNAVATGVNLLGDVHGGAGQQCMAAFDRAVTAMEAGSSLDEAVAGVLAEFRAQDRFVPGFGHRFHPRDPRRGPLLELVSDAVAEDVADERYLTVALEFERQLAHGRTHPVPMNIDGATATVYSALGFEPDLGRGLFVLSRSVGILSHAWEEQQGGRKIKGPLPPPLLAGYTGPPHRDVPGRGNGAR